MNSIATLKHDILAAIAAHFSLDETTLARVEVTLTLEKGGQFGDLSTNAALVLAKALKQNPRELGTQIVEVISGTLGDQAASVEMAGPGFVNITLSQQTWLKVATQLHTDLETFFAPSADAPRSSYLLEYVSANPTGPLHIGHGRGAIIGDVLGRILKFLNHKVATEFYINDAGSQIQKLGVSLKARVNGQDVPEDGYHGQYLIDLAATVDEANKDNDASYFADFAKEKMLGHQKEILQKYGVEFDAWFSEKTLHEDGSITKAIDLLKEKQLAYEEGGALWFASTKFGDDKDRVIRKADGSLTYIAADIAYHKQKFDRGFATLIDILGQDHHGYVRRLKATMQALGYSQDQLLVILYQLVSIKIGDATVKMSKRAGTFTTLEEIIEAVGTDVARFFYLNRKADTHLDFDLEAALKKTEENPVYYIQYAYVRTSSLLQKAAAASDELAGFVKSIATADAKTLEGLTIDEIDLLKKVTSLQDILHAIEHSHQTHLLAYYSWELAQALHNFYAKARIIDVTNLPQTKRRLLLVHVLRGSLTLCLNLLGLSQPEKM